MLCYSQKEQLSLSTVSLKMSGWSFEKSLCKSDRSFGCSDFEAKSKGEDLPRALISLKSYLNI